MSARVLLISANRYAAPYPVFPLGLACVDHALRSAGHITAWLDRLVDGRSVAEAVTAFRPDYTGISLRNIDDVLIRKQETFHDVLEGICTEAREAGSGPVVLGGSGFSIFPREILAAAGADYGIQGEGEASLVRLIAVLEEGHDLAGVPGLVYRREEVRACAKRRVGEPGLPEGSFRPVPCRPIASSRRGTRVLTQSGEIVANPPAPLPTPPGPDLAAVPPRIIEHYLGTSSMLCVQTQRGCPFRCAYCTYPVIEGHASRRRDPVEVAKELAALEARGAGYAFIVDSVFNTSPDHVKRVCEALIRRGVGLKWGCFLRPQGLTRELMTLMVQAGLAHVEFGSDSFCDEVLAAFDKRLTFADILEASRRAAEAHVDFCHFLICGGPGETEATLETTFANSQRLPGGVVMAMVGVRVYPGTALAREVAPHERAEALLPPRYHIAAGLDADGVFRRLEDFSRRAPNWIVGDPPPAYLHMAEKLRRRGVVGPLWSYFAMMQRLAPALRR